MKKFLVLFLISLLLLGILCGCGQGATTNEGENGETNTDTSGGTQNPAEPEVPTEPEDPTEPEEEEDENLWSDNKQ